MRLHFSHPGVRRIWTVELRPQPGGPVLVCQQCTHDSRLLDGPSARAEALAHLALHARRTPVPPHLRTCQCHERGCCWHRRHRGCQGPIRLLLARERGGRLWRLTDACTACAAATSEAAVVPDTILTAAATSSGRANTRRRRCPKGPDSQTRVREMLNYLAAALPAETGAGARMLALQCALRMNESAQVRLPCGVLRSLRLESATDSWRELNEAGLLRTFPSDKRAVAVQILDAGLLTQHPARPDRLRAADWAMRSVCRARASSIPLLQLAALFIVARTTRGSGHGMTDMDQMARECGFPAGALPPLLNQLVEVGVLTTWQVAPEAGDLSWTLGPNGIYPESVTNESN